MTRIATVIITAAVLVAIVAAVFSILPANKVYLSLGDLAENSSSTISSSSILTNSVATTTSKDLSAVPTFVVKHILPPDAVKGIYFTNWAAGTPSFKKSLYSLLDGTTILNSVVIDVKDYSGRVGFEVSDPDLIKIGSVQKRIPDIMKFIGSLHDKGIYVIGRVAVFQDPYIVKVKPEWAIHDARNGGLWKDSGGAYWADPTNKDFWKYIVSIAKESYADGFDEINFDYVRFPSDGSVSSAVYSVTPKGFYIYKPIPNIKLAQGVASTSVPQASSTKKLATSTRSVATSTKAIDTSTKIIATSTKVFITGKSEVIREFFAYLHDELASSTYGMNIPISADLFGQTTSDTGDMGIGQVIENAMPYFDYIDPMVYPSHYINGFLGYTKPALHPYEIVKYEMDQTVTRSKIASSSPLLMRPWLQAFDLGAIYTPDMVRAQMSATYDAGLSSWILWNAGSVYNKPAVMADPKGMSPGSILKPIF